MLRKTITFRNIQVLPIKTVNIFPYREKGIFADVIKLNSCNGEISLGYQDVPSVIIVPIRKRGKQESQKGCEDGSRSGSHETARKGQEPRTEDSFYELEKMVGQIFTSNLQREHNSTKTLILVS